MAAEVCPQSSVGRSMDPYDERDGDLRSRLSHGIEEHDDEEFSMSSYDGEQGDSLVIKPPQAVIARRDKKRDRRERHRHKGERHKEKHKSREHRGSHEERRRDHRRHREREDRRDLRRHEKHRERLNKHDRLHGDLKTKLKKNQKLMEREQHERRRERERMREEMMMEQREMHEMRHAGVRGNYGQAMYHRDRRHDDRMFIQGSQMGLEVSPQENVERDKRMERLLQAEKHIELSKREADVRRQKREEERREERRMDELRQRAEASMLRHRQGGSHNFPLQNSKRQKHIQPPFDVPETVELISDDEEKPSPLIQRDGDSEEPNLDEEEEEEEMGEEDERDDAEQDGSDKESPHKKGETEDEAESNQSSSDTDVSEDSESSSGSSMEDDEEEEEEEDANEQVHEKSDDAETNKNEDGAHSDHKYSDGPPSDTHSDTSSGHSSDGNSEDENGENADKKDVTAPIEIKEELPSYYPAIMGCRSVDEFECLNRIEEGTYGVVYRAREKSSKEIVALKRLKMEKEKEGFPITSLREVNTLLKSQHLNIVTVREIVVGSNMDKIYIVMDYVEHDLKSLMETMRQKKQSFTIGEVKTLMIQLLRAVHHLHDNWILHRDLKTSNLLLSHRGILKVGDFGLAREYGSPLKQYTPIVVTLWYRAPELLLGGKQYSCHIDVWSVGCIFGELLGMEPMFPGKSEIDQLNKIFKDLGTPREKIWPGYSQLPVVKKTQFVEYPYNHLRERFKTRLSNEGFDLLNKFLTYDPQKRITCLEAMDHAYFHKEPPTPIDPAMFPTWPAKSENPHGKPKKTGMSPKPPSGGKIYKDLVVEDENIAGFFLGGMPSSGPGFTLKF